MNAVHEVAPRQANRILEQAARGSARVAVEPRNAPEGSTVCGRIQRGPAGLLTIEIDGARGDLLRLVGVICDVEFQLSDDRYLFTTCVVDVDDKVASRLLLARPDHIHVVNRRRFERTNASVVSLVRVRTQSGAVVEGTLQSVSAGGLSCAMPAEPGEVVLIGDGVLVEFEIAGFDDRFDLPAVVCSKKANSGVLTIGIEFVRAGNDAVQAQHDLLQSRLDELYAQHLQAEGDS